MNDDRKSPVTGGANKQATGRGTSNRDWWPNQLNLVHTTIHEQKMGVKLGNTFLGMCALINPLDWSQNSTAILQATSRAEWLRHCKRAGLYEQGKLLYEKGGLNPDNLPEEATANVEEDYKVCIRGLARSGFGGEGKKPKRGRTIKVEAEE